jgi:hypothetical protein
MLPSSGAVGSSLSPRAEGGKPWARAERHIGPVSGGTAPAGAAGHPEQASVASVTASEETTMRHALVVTQLIHEARSSGPQAAERQLADAPPEPEAPADPDPEPRPRRLATLFRRARVRALGLGAESPGGGA